MVAAVDALIQVAFCATVEGRAHVLEILLGHERVHAVNLGDEADDAILGVVVAGVGFLDGLHSGTRRAEYDGKAPSHLPRLGEALWHHQQTVECLVLAVQVDAYEVAVGLVGGELRAGRLRELQRVIGRLLQVVLPELPEVLRLLRIRHNLLGRETNLHVVLIGGAVKLHRQADVAEAGLLCSPRLDDATPVLQRDGAPGVGLHQVVAYGVCFDDGYSLCYQFQRNGIPRA